MRRIKPLHKKETIMKYFILLIFISVTLSANIGINFKQTNNCLECHSGIEHIREEKSKMSIAIAKKAKDAGYAKNSCIICHGGNPATKNKNKARVKKKRNPISNNSVKNSINSLISPLNYAMRAIVVKPEYSAD